MVQKLKRQRNKASYIRDKFGLGPGSSGPSTSGHHNKLEKIGKSKSVALPSPTKEESGSILDNYKPTLKKIHSGEALNTSFGDSEFEFTEKSPPLSKGESFEEPPENTLVDYDESPHFPRDKSKYTLSPSKNPSKNLLPQPEPNVDFEFHVKIFIKGGKCVLHTLKEEEKRKMKKDRSFSGTYYTVWFTSMNLKYFIRLK